MTESIPKTSLRDQLSGLSPDALQALLLSLPSDENITGSNIEHTDKQNGEIATGLGLFPATYAQILFWRQYYADPNEYSNNQSMAFRIHGPLDVEALKALISNPLRIPAFPANGILRGRSRCLAEGLAIADAAFRIH